MSAWTPPPCGARIRPTSAPTSTWPTPSASTSASRRAGERARGAHAGGRAANPSAVFGVDLVRRRTRIPCPLHGGDGPSLSVRADGRWTCHSNHCHGDGGDADALAFLAYRAGIAPAGTALWEDAFARALVEAERLLDMAANAPVPPKPPEPKPPASSVADARALWSRAMPLGDARAGFAMRYLTATRGVWPEGREAPGMVRALVAAELRAFAREHGARWGDFPDDAHGAGAGGSRWQDGRSPCRKRFRSRGSSGFSASGPVAPAPSSSSPQPNTPI